MIMPPWLRKLALALHVTASVGWIGAIAAFLALAIVGLQSRDAILVSGVYLAMEVTTEYAIVPLSVASLASGTIQSLGTSWGLFRHYWVLVKLLITAVSTVLLLTHTQGIGYMADVAGQMALGSGDFRELRVQLALDAGAAIGALLVTTLLSVYKPRGLTPYGWRKQREQRSVSGAIDTAPSS
jgi:hypothetical protein